MKIRKQQAEKTMDAKPARRGEKQDSRVTDAVVAERPERGPVAAECITLRDLYAAAALAGIVATRPADIGRYDMVLAWRIAAWMLEERNNRKGGWK